MRQPQPDEGPQAGQDTGQDTRPDASEGSGRGAVQGREASAAEAPVASGDGPAGTRRFDQPESATPPAPWRGAASVPPPQPKQRWWRRDGAAEPQPPSPGAAAPPTLAAGGAVPAPRRDPTLRLPAGESPDDNPETRTPVDPWADADLWPAGHAPDAHDTWDGSDLRHGHPPPVSSPAAPPPAPISPPHAAPPPYPPAAPGYPPPGYRPVPAAPAATPRNRQLVPANRPPSGPPPPPAGKQRSARRRPRRQRRRWPWTMSLLTILTVACCCGCPAYFGKPLWDQYPATAALPGQIADLELSEDGASERTVTRLRNEMRTAHLLAEDTFAGVYRDGNGKLVVLFGTTGFRITPDTDLDSEIGRITGQYRLTGVTTFETDIRGAYLSCGTGRADGTDVVVCTWADHGSLGTALFTRRSVEESAALTYRLRTDVIDRE
ncbi:hypothetical protein ACN27F_27410 [Solwaraspora sp. WMMB335]|uniref:hypothetical protein n=1 Tax=Solwaraspora sp. WMMB335 TaxID=3404118 RepID=UPI003B93B9A1